MPESLDLARELIRRHPNAAARTLERLPAADVAAFLQQSPADLGAAVLGRMTLPAAARVIGPLDADAAATLLGAMPTNVTAGILRHLSDPVRLAITGQLPRKAARAVGVLLRHDSDTIGAWMEPRAHVLPGDATIGGAVERLRQSTERKSGPLYVVDRDMRLVGSLDVWDLVVAAPDARISARTRRIWRTLAAKTELRAVVDHPGWSDADEMPVVGGDGRFVGALRHVNVVQAVRARFPGSEGAGMDDKALEMTVDVWDGMSRFLETVAAIATPPAAQEEEGRT